MKYMASCRLFLTKSFNPCRPLIASTSTDDVGKSNL